MVRKKAEPTTKSIRIPIRFEQQVKNLVARLKARDAEDCLEPLPAKAVEELAIYAMADTAISYAGIQVLRRYLLKDWLHQAIDKFGVLGARTQIQKQYGEYLANLILPIPPMAGEWWEVLGVSPVSSLEEVRRVHRELAAQWHPDRNATPEAKAVMQAINRAWAEYKKQVSSSPVFKRDSVPM